MSNAQTIERWTTEAGISTEQIEYRDGEPMVWRACGRCNGTGYVWATHVEGGRCFSCNTAKGKFVSLRKLAANARARSSRETRRMLERREGPRRAAADAREFLAANEGLAAALRTRGVEILRSFARQLARKGRISERQVEVALKIARETAEKADQPVVEVPEGRQTVTGKVMTLKEQDGYRPGTMTLKMLVEDDRGFRVWGTVPASIYDVERGERVSFVATLDPKEAGFGFFSRPAKAERINPE